MIWGLTPTVGIQVIGVSLTWFVGRRAFNWDFNYLIALTWTIVTNPLTFLPLYYVFYVTGKFMLGGGGDNGLTGYQAFVGVWDQTFEPDTGWFEVVGTYFFGHRARLGPAPAGRVDTVRRGRQHRRLLVGPALHYPLPAGAPRTAAETARKTRTGERGQRLTRVSEG